MMQTIEAPVIALGAHVDINTKELIETFLLSEAAASPVGLGVLGAKVCNLTR